MSANESSGLRSDTVPWQASNLHVVLASSMVGIMGVSLLTPVLPQLKGVFGVGDAVVGLIIPAFTIPGVVLTPFIGLLADRIGRRRTLVPLLILFGVAGAAVAFASTFRQVLVLRVLQGVGGSALIMLAITLIGDYYDDPRRSAVIGINGGAIGSSGAIFPLVGGTLAAIRWQVPFLFFGVAILVGLYALSVLDEPTIDDQQSVREYFRRIRSVVAYPRAVAANLTVFVHFFMFYGMLTAIPLVLGDSYGLSSGRIGIVLATLSVASAACNNPIRTDFYPRRPGRPDRRRLPPLRRVAARARNTAVARARRGLSARVRHRRRPHHAIARQHDRRSRPRGAARRADERQNEHAPARPDDRPGRVHRGRLPVARIEHDRLPDGVRRHRLSGHPRRRCRCGHPPVTVVATSTTHRYKNGKRLEPVIDSRHVDFEAIVTLDEESSPEAAIVQPTPSPVLG